MLVLGCVFSKLPIILKPVSYDYDSLKDSVEHYYRVLIHNHKFHWVWEQFITKEDIKSEIQCILLEISANGDSIRTYTLLQERLRASLRKEHYLKGNTILMSDASTVYTHYATYYYGLNPLGVFSEDVMQYYEANGYRATLAEYGLSDTRKLNTALSYSSEFLLTGNAKAGKRERVEYQDGIPTPERIKTWLTSIGIKPSRTTVYRCMLRYEREGVAYTHRYIINSETTRKKHIKGFNKYAVLNTFTTAPNYTITNLYMSKNRSIYFRANGIKIRIADHPHKFESNFILNEVDVDINPITWQEDYDSLIANYPQLKDLHFFENINTNQKD